MVQRGERAGFALEAGQALGIVCKCLRQDLNRNVTLELRVPRAIDNTHTARADLGANFIGASWVPGASAITPRRHSTR
jgi:hypothetical protein